MATSWEIINLLLDINKKGTTVIMATHNPDFVKNLQKRVVKMDKGQIIADTKHLIKHKNPPSPKATEGHREEVKKDDIEEAIKANTHSSPSPKTMEGQEKKEK